MPRKDLREPADEDVKDLFDRIFRVILKDVVRKVCVNLCRDPDRMDVDEFAQRIGVLLWEEDYRVLRSFKHESSLETWLFTIAKRHILRWLREWDRIGSLEDYVPDSFNVQQYQEKKLLLRERRKILQSASSKLPVRKQQLLGLWLQELSIKEIAGEMGIKRDSVIVGKVKLVNMLKLVIGSTTRFDRAGKEA